MSVNKSVTPLLVLSDAITSRTGLARIARELACRIHADPALSSRFRVGAYGVGGDISTSSRFPFFNASIHNLDNMIPLEIGQVWTDFAGTYGDGRQEDSEQDLTTRRGQTRQGICLTIMNCSWVGWLAKPELLPDSGAVGEVRDFLLQRPPELSLSDWAALPPTLRARHARRPFARWLYCPVDGHCADGTLGWQMGPILAGFDRVLAYTDYGARVIERTLEKWQDANAVKSVPSLPHGTDVSVFFPRDRALARQTLISRLSNGSRSLPLLPDQLLLLFCGTNTPRKDWGLAFEVCEDLLRRGRNIFLWGHTDTLRGHWDLPALARQFGMLGGGPAKKDNRVMLTTDRLSDDDMAWGYAAADCYLSVGNGEGWGWGCSEALACGLPVVSPAYAGGADFCPRELQVEPVGFFQEGKYCIRRGAYNPEDWAAKVEQALAQPRTDQSLLPPDLEWDQCWPRWREWLLQGVAR